MTLRIIFFVGFVAIVLAESSKKLSEKLDDSSRSARQISEAGCPYGDCDGLNPGRYANSGSYDGNVGVPTSLTARPTGPNGYDESLGRGGPADNGLGRAYRQTSFVTQNGPNRQGRFDQLVPSTLSFGGGSQQPSFDLQRVTTFQTSNGSPGQTELRIPIAVQATNVGQRSDVFPQFAGSDRPVGGISPILGGVDPSSGGVGRSLGPGSQTFVGANPNLAGANPSFGGLSRSSSGVSGSFGLSGPTLAGANPSFSGVSRSIGTCSSPTLVRANPSFDGVNPSFDGVNPSFGGVNPSFGSGSPTLFVGANPSFVGANPSFDGINPSLGGLSPLLGNGSPIDGRNPWWPGAPGATVGPQPGQGWPSFNFIGVSPDRNIGTQGVPFRQCIRGPARNGPDGSARNGGNPGGGGFFQYVPFPGPIGPQYFSPSGLPGALDGSRNFVDWGNSFVDPARSSQSGNLPWINAQGADGAVTQLQNGPALSPNLPTNRPDDTVVNWSYPDGTGPRWGNTNRWGNVLNALRFGRTCFRFLAHGMHKLANRT